MLKLGSCFPQP